MDGFSGRLARLAFATTSLDAYPWWCRVVCDEDGPQLWAGDQV